MSRTGRERPGRGRRLGLVALVTTAALAVGTSSALASFVAGPQTLSASEGSALSGQVAQFTTDPGGSVITSCADNTAVPSVYSATIDWGDGTTSSGTLSFLSASGLFPFVTACTYGVSGSHTYGEEHAGAPVKVTVTNIESILCAIPPSSCDGPGGEIDSTANVADAPLSGDSGGVTAAQDVPFAGTVATFHDLNPSAPVSDYSATVNWGDGSSSPGTVTTAGSGFQVLGSHTYTAPGGYVMSVAIHDAGGSSIQPASTATVAPKPTTAASSKPRPKARCPKGKHRVGKGKRAHCVRNKTRHHHGKSKGKGHKH